MLYFIRTKFFIYIKEFGIKYAFDMLFYYLKKHFNTYNLNQYRISIILEYLKKHFRKCVFREAYIGSDVKNNYKVFVCWWQGLDENTPELIRKCINNLKDKFKHHEVIVIDKYNVNSYVTIPKYILKKANKGIISLTHLSDVLRFHLLAKYDGCWIDSTCWLTESIEDDLNSYIFYSNKLKPEGPMLKYVSRGQWSGFFIKTNMNNPIIISVRDMLDLYWKKHNLIIDYFLFDYFIYITYLYSKEAKKMIGEIPLNNEHIHDLLPLLDKEYDENVYKTFINNTKIFKLTYKKDLSKRSTNSYYDIIINNQDKNDFYNY